MKLIKGKKIADKILENLKREIEKENPCVSLAVILVGEDEASKIYVELKKKAAKIIGMGFFLFRFTNVETRLSASLQTEIINKIKALNADKKISGIIVQLPLLKGLNTEKIIGCINPKKDADGFCPENIRLFLKGEEKIWPAFPMAIIKMIESTDLDFSNKKAVIVAKSQKFGKIMKAALGKKRVEAEYILLEDFNLAENLQKIKKADILVTACGIPGLIKGRMVKENAIIIDGGITKISKKVLGDVDAESVKDIAGWLSPVPGGVGPVTVACLLENVMMLA